MLNTPTGRTGTAYQTEPAVTDGHSGPGVSIAELSIGRALARHPKALLAPTLLLAAGAIGVALAAPVVYSAQARLLVGDVNASGSAVPGYTLATQELAGTLARLSSSNAVMAAVAARMHTTPGAIPGTFSASEIPQSSEILVDSHAHSSADAVRLAAGAANGLIDYANRISSQGPGSTTAKVLASYQAANSTYQQDATNAQILQGRLSSVDAQLNQALQNPAAATVSISQLQSEQATLAQQVAAAQAQAAVAKTKAGVLQNSYASMSQVSTLPIETINSAVPTGSDLESRVELYGAAGALAGAAAGVVWAVTLERRRPLRVR